MELEFDDRLLDPKLHDSICASESSQGPKTFFPEVNINNLVKGKEP
jgi:hypothetical protein